MPALQHDVRREAHWLLMADGAEVYVKTWEDLSPSKTAASPRAVLQLAHGMAEHIHRYDAFAAWMAERGITVVGNDHRGHGRTGDKAGGLGYVGDFAHGGGFDRMTEDLREISLWAAARYPGAPLVLMGHSMGSMLARRYIQMYGQARELAGLIIMGTAGDPGLLGGIGRWIARTEVRRKGANTPSPLLNRLVFGPYNKRIRHPDTLFDWLSRDTREVAKYMEDPYCGFIPSAAFYVDLLTGMQRIHDDRLLHNVPSQLPMLFVSGDEDPVGGYGKGVREVIEQYKRHGVRHIDVHMYDGARHEPLNEVNRDEVFAGIFQWLMAHVVESAG